MKKSKTKLWFRLGLDIFVPWLAPPSFCQKTQQTYSYISINISIDTYININTHINSITINRCQNPLEISHQRPRAPFSICLELDFRRLRFIRPLPLGAGPIGESSGLFHVRWTWMRILAKHPGPIMCVFIYIYICIIYIYSFNICIYIYMYIYIYIYMYVYNIYIYIYMYNIYL